MTILDQIKQQLNNEFSEELVNELFSAFTEIKNYYRSGKFRPAALEGARFQKQQLECYRRNCLEIILL